MTRKRMGRANQDQEQRQQKKAATTPMEQQRQPAAAAGAASTRGAFPMQQEVRNHPWLARRGLALRQPSPASSSAAGRAAKLHAWLLSGHCGPQRADSFCSSGFLRLHHFDQQAQIAAAFGARAQWPLAFLWNFLCCCCALKVRAACCLLLRPSSVITIATPTTSRFIDRCHHPPCSYILALSCCSYLAAVPRRSRGGYFNVTKAMSSPVETGCRQVSFRSSWSIVGVIHRRRSGPPATSLVAAP